MKIWFHISCNPSNYFSKLLSNNRLVNPVVLLFFLIGFGKRDAEYVAMPVGVITDTAGLYQLVGFINNENFH